MISCKEGPNLDKMTYGAKRLGPRELSGSPERLKRDKIGYIQRCLSGYRTYTIIIISCQEGVNLVKMTCGAKKVGSGK